MFNDAQPLIDAREALLINRYCSSLNRPPPFMGDGRARPSPKTPPNSGGEWEALIRTVLAYRRQTADDFGTVVGLITSQAHVAEAR
jgi:hypothetical protein